MCQINQCEGTESFVAIHCVLRELFTNKLWGVLSTPLTIASVKNPLVSSHVCISSVECNVLLYSLLFPS